MRPNQADNYSTCDALIGFETRVESWASIHNYYNNIANINAMLRNTYDLINRRIQNLGKSHQILLYMYMYNHVLFKYFHIPYSDACLRCQTEGKQEECVGMDVYRVQHNLTRVSLSVNHNE